MGSWGLFVNILFPIPFVSLLLLCIPLPLPAKWAYKVRKFITIAIDKVLFFQIAGKISVYQLAVSVSMILFALTAWETASTTSRLRASTNSLREDKLYCLKLRYERNFWISMFSLVMWLILYKFQQLTVDNQRYRLAMSENETTKKDD